MDYRKKPVAIQAVQFIYDVKGIKKLKKFCGSSAGTITKDRHMGAKAELEILTLEDGHDNRVKHIATEGDWIIRGVQGEFYPCKPDIFEKTYEKISSIENIMSYKEPPRELIIRQSLIAYDMNFQYAECGKPDFELAELHVDSYLRQQEHLTAEQGGNGL